MIARSIEKNAWKPLLSYISRNMSTVMPIVLLLLCNGEKNEKEK